MEEVRFGGVHMLSQIYMMFGCVVGELFFISVAISNRFQWGRLARA